MILDLGPLPYQLAIEILKWCLDHKIDEENCIRLIDAFTKYPVSNVGWTIDVPDKHVTFFLLKWNGH